jgi:hypothetical protein
VAGPLEYGRRFSLLHLWTETEENVIVERFCGMAEPKILG